MSLSLEQRKIINMFLSQLISINYGVKDLVKYNILRLYLIKSFRGRAQAMGKPSRGQRTWSNAWTAYKYNRMLRQFIIDIKKKLFHIFTASSHFLIWEISHSSPSCNPSFVLAEQATIDHCLSFISFNFNVVSISSADRA